MSVFLAFRTAAVAVLRPTRAQTIPQKAFPLLIRGMKATRTHPKNGQIPYEIVEFQDENGTLHPGQQLRNILDSTNLSTHIVRLISHEPPVVQVFTQVEDKMHKLERKVKKKVDEERRHIQNKDAQMSWFTAGQDFDHKVSKIYEDLEKGDIRIDVYFNPKAKVRNPTRDEMTNQLDEVSRRVADIGLEWREREFRRGTARMFLQSTVKKEKHIPTQEEVKEMAHEEVKRQERQALRKRQRLEEKEKHTAPST